MRTTEYGVPILKLFTRADNRVLSKEFVAATWPEINAGIGMPTYLRYTDAQNGRLGDVHPPQSNLGSQIWTMRSTDSV